MHSQDLVHDADVQLLLDRLADAVAIGDAHLAATLWALPAFIIGADGAMPVSSIEQLEPLLDDRDHFEARGIVGVCPELVHVERIGDTVVAHVRWPYHDASGHEVGAETADYTLQPDDHGELKVRCVLIRGVER